MSPLSLDDAAAWSKRLGGADILEGLEKTLA